MPYPRPTLVFDPEDFRRDYEQRPFVFHHDLGEHPLFQFDKLLELAQELPQEDVEYNAGDVPVNLPEGRKPEQRMSPAETMRRIRECQTWLGLKKVAQVPEYRALIDMLLDRVQPLIEPLFPGMYQRDGFIFVTSPRSRVPFHMDPEHNFLFQIRGGKSFTIFDRTDRTVVPEQEIERHYTQDNRRMILLPEHATRGTRIELRPGDALHVPINAAHFVENDDEVSISISVTFATARADEREMVYKINHRLRGLGLAPAPFGVSAPRDRLKVGAFRAFRAVKSLRGKAL